MNENPFDRDDAEAVPPREEQRTNRSSNSAYLYNNPDFAPERDVPGARGCANTIDIIGND